MRFLPAAFAPYSPASACTMRSAGAPASSGKTAMPPEIVTGVRARANRSSILRRIRSATTNAPSREVSGSSTANSSPP